MTQIPRDGKGYQEIADPAPRNYRKVILKDGIVVGMLSLGNRKEALAFKRAIDHKVNLKPIASQLFKQDFRLNEWLDRESVPPPLLATPRIGTVGVYQKGFTKEPTGRTSKVKPQVTVEATLVPYADNTRSTLLLSQTIVMSVGRQVGSYLLIDHESISRRHAEISYTNDHYVVRDLGSSNGTYVNEVPLEAGKAQVLKPGDRVRFGKVVFTFVVKEAQAANDAKIALQGETLTGKTRLHDLTTGFYDPQAADQALPPSGQPILHADGSLLLPGATQALTADIVATFKKDPALILITKGSPQVTHLKQGKRITVGRDKTCNIVLADVSVSRKHAEIVPGQSGFYIRDLGSANGVRVNQTKIDNPYLLAHGDRITIGGTTIFHINIRQDENANAEQRSQSNDIQSDVKEHLKVTCHQCGASNLSIARFCATCGTPLGNAEAKGQ